MENICLAETNSVNDDIDLLFEELKISVSFPSDEVTTYFLPKLTYQELKLAETKDQNFFKTFVHSKNPDVEKTEMEQSESDSKFVKGWCKRRTFGIEVDYNTYRFETSDSSTESTTESSTDDIAEMSDLIENSETVQSINRKSVCCECCSVQ